MFQETDFKKSSTLEETAAALAACSRCAVFSHEEPDGDAIGSQVAVTLALRGLGKTAVALRSDPISPTLAFLNRGPVIEKYDPARHGPVLARCDAAIMVDCCDFYRLGHLEAAAQTVPGPIINIDHHRDNGFFGTINYVRFNAGGAAQLVFETLKAMGVGITEPIAEALYVGISTDTVNFRYIDPEGRMIAMLGELIEAGIDIELLQERIYCSNRDTYLDDLYAILRSVSYERDGHLAWFTLYRSEHLSFYQRELASEALKQLLSLERVRAAVMMHEENAGVEVWLRSKRDADVGDAAKVLGGGGHRTAAGALLRGARLEEAVPRVLKEVGVRMEPGS